MHITRIHIEGFKRFTKFDLELNANLNVIVGDNETGKSSVLEAIGLVLTGKYDGRLIQYAIDPYLFNVATVAEYFEKQRKSENAIPPTVFIEAYLQADSDNSALAKLEGRNNSKSEDCPGLVLTIEVDSEYVEALKKYARDDSNPTVLPVEFYRVKWTSFSGNRVTLRDLPFRASTIDTGLARVYRGPNTYITQAIHDALSEEQQYRLSHEYKKLRHKFTQEPEVAAINDHLKQKGNPATTKKLTIQMDMSSRSSWDSAITAHLDDLPFDCAGKGEQCRVQLRLAIAEAKQSQVLLIEEPENHLSHSNLNMLMNDISKDCADRQVIVTTHSAFVLNKLGIDNLRLIAQSGQTVPLTGLTSNTKAYFMKLPGYDTLRLILSKRSILVEGPSDELIVQRAYKDVHLKLPLENGIDVISVGTAFKRFLEIATSLDLNVCAIIDNDGNVKNLEQRYAEYLDGTHKKVKICFDKEDESCRTLEPQLLKANSLESLNDIFNSKHASEAALLNWMGGKNKTECALRMFETEKKWTVPEYIRRAIE